MLTSHQRDIMREFKKVEPAIKRESTGNHLVVIHGAREDEEVCRLLYEREKVLVNHQRDVKQEVRVEEPVIKREDTSDDPVVFQSASLEGDDLQTNENLSADMRPRGADGQFIKMK
jgi:hypothetical protein